ncbi:MAG: hypothetical protein P8L49_13570 [Opitutaceae bacterium]|nr:hypothetical protein [Opitutaceae bacterium]
MIDQLEEISFYQKRFAQHQFYDQILKAIPASFGTFDYVFDRFAIPKAPFVQLFNLNNDPHEDRNLSA